MASASDKADWAAASEGICRGTIKGAVAGASEWKTGRLDTVQIVWGSRPQFLKRPDGTVEVLTDSDEPDVKPVQVTVSYVHEDPKPELPGKKEA